MKRKYIEDDKRGNCNCGHTHIYWVGDLGKDEDESGYDLIDMCCYCDCESFKRRKKQ